MEKYVRRLLKVAKIEAKSWDNDKCPAVKSVKRYPVKHDTHDLWRKFMERVQAEETCEDDLVKFESCYKKYEQYLTW